jgi:hypothetical protein
MTIGQGHPPVRTDTGHDGRSLRESVCPVRYVRFSGLAGHHRTLSALSPMSGLSAQYGRLWCFPLTTPTFKRFPLAGPAAAADALAALGPLPDSLAALRRIHGLPCGSPVTHVTSLGVEYGVCGRIERFAESFQWRSADKASSVSPWRRPREADGTGRARAEGESPRPSPPPVAPKNRASASTSKSSRASFGAALQSRN